MFVSIDQHKNHTGVKLNDGICVSHEQQVEREKLIDTLTNYQFSRFGDRILEQFPDIFNSFHQCSKQELELRLLTLQKFIQKHGGRKQGELIFHGVLGVCNYSCTLLGMNVTGAHESLISDSNVLDTVEEVQLKYKAKIQVDTPFNKIEIPPIHLG